MRNKKTKKPAIFLDRDGTLIRDVGYLSSPSQIRIFPQTAGALKKLREAGFLLLVVTNQSGVARGYFSKRKVQQVHQELQRMLRSQGARIDAFFYCPHFPQAKVKLLSRRCDCRKPSTGMVKQALRRYAIDLKRSYVVGDKVDDLLLAYNAKVAAGVLVRTGSGRESEKELKRKKIIKYKVVSNMTRVAEFILSRQDTT